MTAEELEEFIAALSAEVDGAIVELAAIDFAALPRDLQVIYDKTVRGWVELRRMSDDEIVTLFAAACELEGRELSLDEMCRLLCIEML